MACSVMAFARTAAGLVTNLRCTARCVLDVARINKAVLAKELGYEMPRGPSPFEHSPVATSSSEQ